MEHAQVVQVEKLFQELDVKIMELELEKSLELLLVEELH